MLMRRTHDLAYFWAWLSNFRRVCGLLRPAEVIAATHVSENSIELI